MTKLFVKLLYAGKVFEEKELATKSDLAGFIEDTKKQMKSGELSTNFGNQNCKITEIVVDVYEFALLEKVYSQILSTAIK